MPQQNAHKIKFSHPPSRLSIRACLNLRFCGHNSIIFVLGFLISLLILPASFAQGLEGLMNKESDGPVSQKMDGSVELNGDRVEFVMEENKFVAEGNVSVIKGDVVLTCDKVEFFRATKMAVAQGHVVLISGQGKISGDSMTFNFEKMTGEFMGAKIVADPFYGAGESLAKVDENHIAMKDGYLTTCD